MTPERLVDAVGDLWVQAGPPAGEETLYAFTTGRKYQVKPLRAITDLWGPVTDAKTGREIPSTDDHT